MFYRLFLTSLLLAFTATAQACEGQCANGLVYEAFGDKQKATTLAVFVHGDVSRGGAADYMYSHARSFAASHKGVVAVAILRPGYYDKAGRVSDGSDNGRRDAYTRSNNSTLAGAIEELKTKYGASRVIALGHSGGAAMLGVIAGRNEGLINGLVLVSCPCDIATWRAARGRGQWGSSQSPLDYLPNNGRIVAVTGANDDNTAPSLAEDYISKLKAKGVSATVQIVSGGHDFNGALASSSVRALSGLAR
jgi:predicted esterase